MSAPLSNSIPEESVRGKTQRRANNIIKDYEQSWRSHHQDILRYTRPRRGRWIGDRPNRGDKMNQVIINSRASESIRITQAGLHGGLTSPNWPWMKLGVKGIEQDDLLGDSAKWVDDIEKDMYRVFQGSNLYSIFPNMYSDVTSVAIAAIYEQEHPTRVVHFTQHSIGSFGVACGQDGQVDTIVREFYRTVGQLRDQFGIANLTEASQTKVATSHIDDYVKVRHIIEPNDARIANQIGWRGFPYRSFWYESDAVEDKWLRRSGYEEFPLMIPRWETAEDVAYGNDCPGFMAIGHIRQLQTMERRKAEALQKMLEPPLDVPSQHPVSLSPRAINRTTPGGQGQSNRITPIIQIMPVNEALQADIIRLEAAIDRAFFADLFITIIQSRNDPAKTATEIAAIQGEKLLMLGPVLERVFEALRHLVERTYNIMLRRGMIPEAPQELEGQEISVEFISTLAQAQRAVGVVSIDRFVGFVGNLAGVRPDVLDVPNWDKITERYASLLNVDPDLITDPDQREAERAARSLAARNVQMAETGKTGAEAARLLSETEPDQGLLRRVLEGGGVGT